MKNSIRSISHVLIYSYLIMTLTNCSKQIPIPPPPETHRGDVVEEIHGVTIADPYRWLEDQESPETRAWLDEQNDTPRVSWQTCLQRNTLQTAILNC